MNGRYPSSHELIVEFNPCPSLTSTLNALPHHRASSRAFLHDGIRWRIGIGDRAHGNRTMLDPNRDRSDLLGRFGTRWIG